MRETKFRAWNEDHFIYSDEIYGDTLKDGDGWFGFEDGVFKAWVSVTVTPGDMYEPPYSSSEELDIIEQFTSLKDRTDKTDVYEGDLCQRNPDEPIFEVKWDNERAMFYLYNKEYGRRDMSFVRVMRVFSNIHERENLLEAK